MWKITECSPCLQWALLLMHVCKGLGLRCSWMPGARTAQQWQWMPVRLAPHSPHPTPCPACVGKLVSLASGILLQTWTGNKNWSCLQDHFWLPCKFYCLGSVTSCCLLSVHPGCRFSSPVITSLFRVSMYIHTPTLSVPVFLMEMSCIWMGQEVLLNVRVSVKECYLTNKLYVTLFFSTWILGKCWHHQHVYFVSSGRCNFMGELMGLTSRGSRLSSYFGLCLWSTVYEPWCFAPHLNSKNSIYRYRKGVAKETAADEACHLCE